MRSSKSVRGEASSVKAPDGSSGLPRLPTLEGGIRPGADARRGLCYNRQNVLPGLAAHPPVRGGCGVGLSRGVGDRPRPDTGGARLAPSTEERDADRPRVHTGAIPLTGGVAIVTAILVPAAFFLDLDGPYLGILLGTLGVAALGLFDDVQGVRPSVKLGGVALLALIPVVGYGVTFEHITLPFFGNHDIGAIGYLLTIFWVALLANLVNLIDGMDALAAGIVAIAAASFALLAASFGRTDAAVLAAIVCGSTLGFLRYNYHPAKVFMGDSGALALGFMLALIAVEGVLKTAATIALVAPMLVIAVPILDTSFVVLKRVKYGRPFWGADHNHFYHRFLRIGFSQRRTAAYLHLWAGALSAYAILLRFVPPRPAGEWDTRNAQIGNTRLNSSHVAI